MRRETESKDEVGFQNVRGDSTVRLKDAQSKALKRLAKYGFLFFLIKGLLWLLVPITIALFLK